MEIGDVLEVLDGSDVIIRETPIGSKLAVNTPSDEDWHATNDEIRAANWLFDEYEDVAVAVYEANSDDEIERILHDADVDEPAKVVGRVENIPLTSEECRQLMD